MKGPGRARGLSAGRPVHTTPKYLKKEIVKNIYVVRRFDIPTFFRGEGPTNSAGTSP